jgi:hypothetical protein
MWTLVLLVYAGALSDSDSVAITNVPGFFSQQECIVAGDESKKMVGGTKKVLQYKCFRILK